MCYLEQVLRGMDGGSETEMGRQEDKVSWCIVRGRSPENLR